MNIVAIHSTIALFHQRIVYKSPKFINNSVEKLFIVSCLFCFVWGVYMVLTMMATVEVVVLLRCKNNLCIDLLSNIETPPARVLMTLTHSITYFFLLFFFFNFISTWILRILLTVTVFYMYDLLLLFAILCLYHTIR